MSQDQRLDAKVVEKSIMEQVYVYTGGAITVNTILILWNSIPIVVFLGYHAYHHYENYKKDDVVQEEDDQYQRN